MGEAGRNGVGSVVAEITIDMSEYEAFFAKLIRSAPEEQHKEEIINAYAKDRP